MSPLLAQSGHSSRIQRCPLSEVKRTLLQQAAMSASDPRAGHGRRYPLSAPLKKKTSLRIFRVATSTSRHSPSHLRRPSWVGLQVQRQRVHNYPGCVGLVVDRCDGCAGCDGDYRQCPNTGVRRQQSPCPNSKGNAVQKRGLQRMGCPLSARKGMAMRRTSVFEASPSD